MYNFSEVRPTNKDQQIRAWCVEKSIDHLRNTDVSYQGVITLSKMIEDYVTNGDVTGVIQTAVEEGYSEGRFEAADALVEDLVVLGEGGIPVDVSETVQSIFQFRGWIRPQNDDATETEGGDPNG